MVLGSDTSDEGSSSDCGSDNGKEVAELDDEGDDCDTMPTPVVTEADDDQEIQDLEPSCE